MSSKKRLVAEFTPEEQEVLMTQLKLLSKLPGEDRWGVIQHNEQLIEGLSQLELEEPEPTNPSLVEKMMQKKETRKINEFLEWYRDIRLEAEKLTPLDDESPTILDDGPIDEMNRMMQSCANGHRQAQAQSLRSYCDLLRQFSYWRVALKKSFKEEGLLEKDCVTKMKTMCSTMFGLNYMTLQGNTSRVLALVNEYPRLLYSGADKTSLKEYSGAFKKHVKKHNDEHFWKVSIEPTPPTIHITFDFDFDPIFELHDIGELMGMPPPSQPFEMPTYLAWAKGVVDEVLRLDFVRGNISPETVSEILSNISSMVNLESIEAEEEVHVNTKPGTYRLNPGKAVEYLGPSPIE